MGLPIGQVCRAEPEGAAIEEQGGWKNNFGNGNGVHTSQRFGGRMDHESGEVGQRLFR
jgi:hypothetical protein